MARKGIVLVADAADWRTGGAERTAWETLLDQGAIMLVLDLTEAFERVSLPVVWAWATHFNFPRMILRVPCGYFEHPRRVHFEWCVAEPFQTITGILLGSTWSCLLLRIVLQDALSEVMKVYPPMKLKVFFVDEMTPFMQGRNTELPGIAEKVLKSIRKEAEEKGLKLSITEGGKQGKNMVIASCCYLEEKFQECSKRRSWSCNQGRNTRSGLENEHEAVGSKSEGLKGEV